MKVYLLDLWPVFVLKASRRSVSPLKFKYPLAFAKIVLIVAMCCFALTSLTIGSLIYLLANKFLGIGNGSLPYIVSGCLLLSLSFLFFRFLIDDRWFKIEKAVDEKYSQRNRDLVFFTYFLAYMFVHTFVLIWIFICDK